METPGPTGCGVFLCFQDGREAFRSRALDPGSNSMAEVEGMLLAARTFNELGAPDNLPLFIFCDLIEI